VVKLFAHYHWQGNVRQLFNVLRTASVMAANEAMITSEHLSDDFLEDARSRLPPEAIAATQMPAAATAPERAAPADRPLPEAPTVTVPAQALAAGTPAARAAALPAHTSRSLEELEIEAIRHALDAAGGNISEASKRLGVSRNTIYRKLRWNNQK
jgi:transcriptional regulator of acetoin/glycerol metabolism